MRVTKSALDRYRKEVDDQAELAKTYVLEALDEYFLQNPSASTADGRRFALALLEAALPNFTDAAGTLAVDFFDELMEAEGIEVDSQLYDMTDYSVVEDKVRFFAEKLNGGDEAAFKSQVVDATHYFVKRSAYDNMVLNCDANNVRFARVPSGLETCAFCFMLASRGFVYLNEAKARGEHGYHSNCDCCIVPGAKGRTRIDGYDPDTMYRNWASCRRTIGGSKAIMREWRALPEYVRREWVARHGNETKAYNRFMQDRVMAEVRTRDWRWLYTGKIPKVDTSRIDVLRLNDDQRHSFDKEYACAKCLARNGFRMYLIDDPNAKPIPAIPKFDYVIGSTGAVWEAKCPEGNGYLAVAGNIAKADAKFRKIGEKSRIVLSNLDSTMNDEQFWRYFEESLDDPESDYTNVLEILIVFKDESVRRWAK